MTERDRLAADLASIRFGAKVEHPSQYEYDWADRLIALGWTRLPQDERAEWYHRGRQRGLREAAALAQPDALDEDRLARALDLVDPDNGPIEGRLIYTPTGQDRQASLREWAAAIAKAYREDTDAEH